jgi:hypothetical protein
MDNDISLEIEYFEGWTGRFARIGDSVGGREIAE